MTGVGFGLEKRERESAQSGEQGGGGRGRERERNNARSNSMPTSLKGKKRRDSLFSLSLSLFYLTLSPTAALPCFTASMAYSTC